MQIKIKQIIKELEIESKKEGSYAYLPEIIATLNKMLTSFNTSEVNNEKFRNSVIGGLGRLVTEDFYFAESDLGSKIAKIGEQYLNYKKAGQS